MIELDLDKSQKYILTCSYGPDSMALFHALVLNGYDFVVAHVNYHILINANEDEKNLREYCSKYNVSIYVLDNPYDHSMGNEEDVCRGIRYDFFKNLAKSLQIPNILIAHNLNDHLETYMLQKERGNYVKHYGLSPSYIFHDVKFIRPLLHYSKSFLQSYCEQEGVPYSIDYSNFDIKFRRNYLRHKVLNKLSIEEMQKLEQKIDEENNNKLFIETSMKENHIKEGIFIKDWEDLTLDERQALFYVYMEENNLFETVSRGFIDDFFNQCKYHKGTFSLKLNDIIFEYSYGTILIYNDKDVHYEYRVNDGQIDCDKIFSLNIKNLESRLKTTQNTLIIKNISKEDVITIKDYKKKISRCFIDWKVPLILRKIWPGIYNEEGELLYVPRFKNDIVSFKEQILIFNSTNLIKECFFL